MSSRFRALARRLGDDPRFLAGILAAYAYSETIETRDLARRLGCTEAVLDRVSICYRPRPASFDTDVDELAERFGLHADLLAEIVRRADVATLLRRRSDASGLLMAARDRESEKPGVDDARSEL